jgi:outer membrane receptor protein involved in Fe transport
MLQKNWLFVVFFFTIHLLFSQIEISGLVQNKTNNPLELIEVQLQNNDSIVFKSELTNAEGKFKITTEKGIYSLLIRQFGSLLYRHQITANNNLDLGTIQVIEKQQQLQEVVVSGKAKLIERKIDRLVFNVENSISATGGDAIDALKLTPGIKVQINSIGMIGKSTMGVMIDDKIMQLSGEDLISFLRTIPSDNIKSIEVITTPPAKYSAEGNSGLINIKLKKAKKDSWSATTRSSYNQARYATGTIGGNFSYQKKKLGILADVSKSNGKSIYLNNVAYDYPTENWQNKTNNRTRINNWSSLLGLTYDATPKSKINFQYLGNFSKNKIDENNVSNIFDDQTNVLNTNLNTDGFTNRKISTQSVNLNLQQKIDNIGKQFTVNVDYFDFKNNKANTFDGENNNYVNAIFTKQFTDNRNTQKISNFSTGIDFELPYKWANVNFGSRASTTKSNSDVATDIFDNNNTVLTLSSNQVNVFEYTENNQALYGTATKPLGNKWELKAGMRVEFTQAKGFLKTTNTTNKFNYYKFFPTLYVSYKSNENNSWSFNYSRRINRPGYSELNPARWYLNVNSFEEGNPFLQPSFTNNAEFSNTYKELVVSALSISKNENGIGQLTIHDKENNTQQFVRRNYYTYLFVGIDETLTFPVFKWWNLSGNAGGYYSETNANTELLQPNYSGWGAYTSTTNNFVLNKSKTFTGELAYEYNFPARSQEMTISNYSNFRLAMRYALLNNKLRISFFANDIFKTNPYTLSNTTQNISQSFRQYYDSQSFRISLSYKFGNDKISVQKREFGNQDEKNRTGN